MKKVQFRAVLAASVFAPALIPFTALADEPETVREVLVVGQKGAPITVVPRGLSVSLGKDQFDAINALNVEDLMKYTPNFFVRKRFAGDDNAVVALRGANTVQSARTLVLVDGFVVSNFLGNSFGFAPKWNVVGPADVRQFDIVYGPYSARYGGNSMGGVISVSTQTPTKNSTYATVQALFMPFEEYGFSEDFKGYSVEGGLTWKPEDSPWSVRASFRHFDNVGHSMTYNLLTKSSAPGSYTPVTGAYVDPRLASPVYGAASPAHIVQDQARLRIGYQFETGWKLDGMLLAWKTDQDLTDSRTFLKNAQGAPVYQGRVSFNDVNYTASGITHSELDRTEYLAGAKLSGDLKGWDVAANLSRYWIPVQDQRTSNDLLTGINRGEGQQTLGNTPGWWTLDTTFVQAFGGHEIAFGLNSNLYSTDQTTYATTNWITATNRAYTSSTFGKTTTTTVFIEDEIDLGGAYLTLGVRADRWKAFDGGIGRVNGQTQPIARYLERKDSAISPKLSFQTDLADGLNLQLSLGTATRFPTVGELFQGRINSGEVDIDPNSFDPNLRPETSKDLSLILRKSFRDVRITGSLFAQDIKDAVFSFSGLNQNGNVVSSYKNIDRVNQYGVELIAEAKNFGLEGLDVDASVSWMNAETLRNDAAPSAEGVQFPRIPHWRSNGNARYKVTPKFKASLGWRYASRPNSDLFGLVRGDAYGFQTEYFTVDTRLSYAVTEVAELSLGIDNLNNDQAYVSHPLPQRTYMLELKYRN